MANNISVSVVGDVKDINKKLGSVDKQLAGFGKSVGKVGTLLKGAFAFAAGAAVIGQLKGVITAGSDLNETLSKSKTIFGEAAGDIEDFGNKAAQSIGLSKNEAISGAAAFGNFFDQIGIGKKASADMSKSFLTMSGDLASFNNADPSKVMEAFTSATRGEYDALQAFIPTINAAKVETEALRLSHKKSAKQLTDADKANALYSLSVKGMGKAQGDFARTSGGLANQQRILSARFEDVKAKIGSALLPIMTKLMGFINSTAIPAIGKFVVAATPLAKEIGGKLVDGFNKVLPLIKQLGEFITGTLVPGLVSFGGFVRDNAEVFKTLAVAIGAMIVAFKAYQVVMNLVKIGQIALNIVMSLNPIGIVVLAIIALVAAFIYLWKTNDGFRNALIAAWNAIKSAAITVWNAVKGAISKAIYAIKTVVLAVVGAIKATWTAYWTIIRVVVTTVFNAIRSVVSGAINFVKSVITRGIAGIKAAWTAGWNAVKAFVGVVWAGIKSAVSRQISAVVSLARGIGGKIKSAVGSLGGILKQAGRNVIQGLIDGVNGMLGSLKAKFNSVTNLIPDWKGPADKDKKLLTPAGQLIMQGLINGIDKKLPALKRMLGTVSGVIANGVDAQFAPGFTGSLVAGTASQRGGAVNNYITVSTLPGNEAKTGQAIIKAIQAAESSQGKRWRN